MSTTIRHLLNEAEKKGFLGRTWDRIKGILATGVALGGLHWGATKLFPKYAAFTRGVTDTKINPTVSTGALGMQHDINDDLLKIDSDLQNSDLTPDEIEKLTNRSEALKKRAAKLQQYRVQESQNMDETTNIKQFIKQLGEKNYSGADKYLQRVVEDKLKSKITSQYKKQKLY